MPQLDPTWYASQSFWMLVTFCMMFLIMWRFVMPAMRATVDARRSRIETDLQKTEELKNQAARLLKELEDEQNRIKTKTQELFVHAQEEAQALTQQLEADFDTRLSAYISEQERTLAETKKEALQEIAAISENLTETVVQKIVGINISAEEIKQTISSIMEKRA